MAMDSLGNLWVADRLQPPDPGDQRQLIDLRGLDEPDVGAGRRSDQRGVLGQVGQEPGGDRVELMSNRVSLAASVTALLVLAAPSQLPAIKASGALGSVLIKANPVSAGLTMADNVLMKTQAWSDQWQYFVSPIVAAVALTTVAIVLSGRLELGGSR